MTEIFKLLTLDNKIIFNSLFKYKNEKSRTIMIHEFCLPKKKMEKKKNKRCNKMQQQLHVKVRIIQKTLMKIMQLATDKGKKARMKP